MTEAPKVSLLLCTAGTERRVEEIGRLLKSLTSQTFKNFDVIVVDQNKDFNLSPLLRPFMEDLRISHIRSEPGLSLSRNRGLEHASGEICGFPDDDCWYAPDLIERIVSFFDANPGHAGLHGKGSDPEGRDMARFDNTAGEIDKFDVFQRSVSCALFYRTAVVRAAGGFDEKLGLGAKSQWIGCEDYDLPIRLLASGHRLFYDPTIVAYHPCPTITIDRKTVWRARSQSPSFGHLLVKHRYPPLYIVNKMLRPLGGAAVAGCKGQMMRAWYHFAAFQGRVSGVANTLLKSG